MIKIYVISNRDSTAKVFRVSVCLSFAPNADSHQSLGIFTREAQSFVPASR